MRNFPAFAIAAILVSGRLLVSVAGAADWPPALDDKNTTTRTPDGRTIERFVHGARAEWEYPASASGEWNYPPAQETGAPQQNHNSFYLVAPKEPRPQTPLCVVLHSANRTAYDYLGFGCLDRKIDGGDDPSTVMTKAPEDFYALYLNSTNAEWWGWKQTRANSLKSLNVATPAERRVFDTIEWVAARYNVDRNRIYLCGVSMGGCGSLGLGMPHGDIFAAVRVTVPAGTEYVAYRMGGFPESPAGAPAAGHDAWLKQISGAGLADPPVVVDFSAQNDNWSKTQPALLQAAQAGRFPLVLGWGPFRHTTFGSSIAKFPLCEIALAFPWLEIRRNEAYPVFTHASTDQRSPWLGSPSDFDESGQINAWFRWKSLNDTPASFSMQLWLAHPTVTHPPPMPEAATADLTLRRLQQFRVNPGASYDWQLSRAGKPVASGRITPDAANLLTIPQVSISTVPAELSLKPAP